MLVSEVFEAWWRQQNASLQDAVAARVRLLEVYGPSLGRPYVDTLASIRTSNLKELRVPHGGRPIRILFAFDRNRRALLLVAGDKASNKRWYERAIARADAIFARHVNEEDVGR